MILSEGPHLTQGIRGVMERDVRWIHIGNISLQNRGTESR